MPPPKGPVRAYLHVNYDTALHRFRWQLIANGTSATATVAQSTSDFPTEHDARASGRAVMKQLLLGELQATTYAKERRR